MRGAPAARTGLRGSPRLPGCARLCAIVQDSAWGGSRTRWPKKKLSAITIFARAPRFRDESSRKQGESVSGASSTERVGACDFRSTLTTGCSSAWSASRGGSARISTRHGTMGGAWSLTTLYADPEEGGCHRFCLYAGYPSLPAFGRPLQLPSLGLPILFIPSGQD